jgi:hypothetical protein
MLEERHQFLEELVASMFRVEVRNMFLIYVGIYL